MKLRHLFLALILAALLAVSAAAFHVPNLETNTHSPYYGMNTDQEDQADFLNTLGLFQGTNNGYELDRSMNRCEAAAMLVRLLGKEAQALEENHEHPFTDVPEWADPYVGWLWENGLTRGMDESTYGAKKAVTAEQYLIFLSRVLQGGDVADDWWEFGFGLYMCALQASMDQRGFLRGDAVSLSVYALRNPTAAGGSLAQRLLDEGVISDDIFRTEAIEIFESEYSIDENHHLVRETAGVTYTGSATVTYLVTDGGRAPRSYVFALRQEAGETWRLLVLDCVSMDTVADVDCPDLTGLTLYDMVYQTSHGGYDYLWAAFRILCWDGSQLTAVSCQDQPLVDLYPERLAFYSDGSALLMQHGDDLWQLDGAAASVPAALGGVTLVSGSEGCVFGNRPTASGGVEFVRYEPATGAVTVLGSRETTHLTGNFYRSGDELWQYTGGKLVRLAELPITDALSDGLGGAYLLTHNDAGTPGIVRVSDSGVITTALSPDCGHGLEITHLDDIRSDGVLQFSYRKSEYLGRYATRFVYALEREGDHPAIRVVSLQYAMEDSMIATGGYSSPSAFYAEKITEAQQKLNNLGLGIP